MWVSVGLLPRAQAVLWQHIRGNVVHLTLTNFFVSEKRDDGLIDYDIIAEHILLH